MIGPNAAPNPAQAKETNFKMVFVLPQAKNNATIDTASTTILPKNTYCLSDAFVLNTALYKSSINADDVTINCDDIVLITAAKTAANIIPAINGWKIIWPNSIKIASGSVKSIPGFCWK